MTTKYYPIIIDTINLILFVLIITAIDLFFTTSIGVEFSFWEIVCFFVIVFWSYFIRKCINYLWLYIPMNALMFATWFIPQLMTATKIKVLVAVLFLVVLNISYWTNDSADIMKIHYGFVLLIVAAYIGCEYFGNDYYALILYGICILFLVLEMIKKLFENYYELANSGQLTDNMPVREIISNNTRSAVGVTVGIVIAMILVKAEGLIRILKELWFAFAAFIGSLVKPVESVSRIYEEEPVDNGTVPPIPVKSGWLDVLLSILEIILFIALIAVSCFLIYKMVKGIIMLYGRRESEKEKYNVFSNTLEIKEKVKLKKNNDNEYKFFGKSYSDKIRYLYRRRLLSLKRYGNDIKETNTPRENCASAFKNNTNISDATAMYEYVRYSDKPLITKEFFADFKKNIK